MNELILDQHGGFRVVKMKLAVAKQDPNLRLTIDTPEDYKRIAAFLNSGVDVNISSEALIKRCLSFA